MQWKQHTALSTIVFAGILCASADRAWGRIEKFVVDEPIEVYRLSVMPGKTVTIRLESPLLETDKPPGWKLEPSINPSRDTIKLFVPAGVTQAEVMGDLLLATRLYNLTLEVEMADASDVPIDGLIVEHKNERELFQAAVDREASKRVDELMAARNAEYDKKLRELESHGRARAMLLALKDGHETTRLGANAETCQGHGITICGVEWNVVDDYGLLRFVMVNRTPRDVEYTLVQLYDESERRDHLVMLQVDGGEPMPPDSAKLAIASMQRVELAAVVDAPARMGSIAKLAMSSPTAMMVSKFIDLSPAEGEGVIFLEVQPIFGTVTLQLSPPMELRDNTTIMGLGIRTSYAFNLKIAVEGELSVARTGDARFVDVSYNNMQGDVAMSAQLLRLLIGGSLRLGHTYQPVGRLAAGVQVINHDSRFIPAAGGEMNGPGDGLILAGLGVVGMGLDIRLSHAWTLGVATTVNFPITRGGIPSFELGLHVGYRIRDQPRF